jgi:hypothetical protein
MSILGFVSRRPLVTLGAAAGLWWLWPSSSAPSAPARPQAAVLADGFAALAGGDQIALFDEDARRRRELELDDAPAGARVVGVGGHVGLVFRDGKRVAVAVVGEDGRLEQTTRFGKRVASMCQGVATNEHRFGVAWLESDGSVWFVHGPTSPRGGAAPAASASEAIAEIEEFDATAEAPFAEPPKPETCMIASAHEKLALLYTEGSRTTLVLCGKSCAAPRRVELPKQAEVLGFGCTRGGCAIATRGERGATLVTWTTPQGRAQWTKPLPHASERTRVSLAGTGAQVAIAYETANEPVVVTASPAGAIATVWQGQSDAVPGLVHASGRLLVARLVDGALTGSVVRAP